jgi:hypothetical protein
VRKLGAIDRWSWTKESSEADSAGRRVTSWMLAIRLALGRHHATLGGLTERNLAQSAVVKAKEKYAWCLRL